MKKLLLGLILLSSCAHFKWEKDWEFDCEWARFYDFQNMARAQFDHVPYNNPWTKMFCDVDPTSFEYFLKIKRREAPAPLPDEDR